MKTSLGALALLVIAAGCGEKQAPLIGEDINKKLDGSVAAKKEATPPLPGLPEAKPEPMPAIAPTEVTGQVTKEGNQAKGKFEIVKPGAPGWRAATGKLSDLGTKMDAAIMGLKGVFAQGRYDIRTSEMTGYQSIKSIFKDRSHYRFEYVDPTKPSSGNYIIRNGDRRGFMQLNSWVEQDFPTPPSDFRRQLHLMPAFAVQPYVTGKPFWAGFFGTIATKGFKITPEDKVMTMPGGEKRNFHRILATSKDITAEFVIDGKRFLPVTIRVNQKVDAKKSIFSQWSPGWSFNRPIPAESFALPDNVK